MTRIFDFLLTDTIQQIRDDTVCLSFSSEYCLIPTGLTFQNGNIEFNSDKTPVDGLKLFSVPSGLHCNEAFGQQYLKPSQGRTKRTYSNII